MEFTATPPLLPWTKGTDHGRMEQPSVLYIPPYLTHLHGSAVYARLDQRQQVRYNHLCGLMAAEQFLSFEETIIITAVRRLVATPEIQLDPVLAGALNEMINEEVNHARWFRALLAEVEPALYSDGQCFFTRLHWWERLALIPLTRTKDGALVMLWFTLLIEEHSVALSRAMITAGDINLDARFVAVHRRHLADEIRHLPLNIKIIERCFDLLPQWRKRLLAWTFRRVLRDIARPRRANAAVVRRLIFEFPELAEQSDDLFQAVCVDFRDHAPHSDITHPEFHPLTVQSWSTRPEFSGVLVDISTGWRPLPWTVGRRIVMLLGLEIIGTVAYLGVGATAAWLVPHPLPVPTTAIDRWLPFVPELVLVYNSLGLFLLCSAWFPSNNFRRLLRAGLVVTLIAYGCFLTIPLEQTRAFSVDQEPWRLLIAHLHSVDPAINTMPSLHVAYVVLVMLAGVQLPGRLWIWTWGLLILTSTLLIRQHVVLDIMAGLALASCCWWWSGRTRR